MSKPGFHGAVPDHWKELAEVENWWECKTVEEQ